MKLLNSKKGMMDDWMDVVFTLVVAIILSVATYNMTFGKLNDEEVRADDAISEIHYKRLLLEFLKYKTEEGNIADLISESYLNDDYGKIEDKAHEFFSKQDVILWKVRLSVDNEEVFGEEDGPYTICDIRRQRAEFYIPIKGEPETKIKIEIFEGMYL